MLVSHRHRFIYTKTKKTAGTSVESFFERFCMEEGEWEPAHARDQYDSPAGIIGHRGSNTPRDAKWWNHMPAADIKQLLGEEIWNSYFKFCVVRNPFDKCISAFEHFGRNHKVGFFSSLFRGGPPAGMTDEQHRFLNYLQKRPPVDRDTYVIDGEFCLDDVIRFESLQSDISRICEKLSLPFDAELLPQFKKGNRREDATPARLFTAESRKCVEDTFAFELKRFNYAFPEA